MITNLKEKGIQVKSGIDSISVNLDSVLPVIEQAAKEEKRGSSA